jgi:hypothetical protein
MSYYNSPEGPNNYGNNTSYSNDRYSYSQQKPDPHRRGEIISGIVALILGIPINLLSAWFQQDILQNTFSPLIVTSIVLIGIFLILIMFSSLRRLWTIVAICYIVAAIVAAFLFPSILNPSWNPYSPHNGTLVFSDSLKDNSKDRWEVLGYASSTNSCLFIDQAYHATVNNGYKPCHISLYPRNFTFEVQMTIIRGNCGGMSLHDTVTQQEAYLFIVCHDGTFSFDRLDTTTNTKLSSGPVNGLKSTNTIAVVANGNNYDLYINNTEVASVNDSTYNQGSLGVSAVGPNGEVAYTNARIWDND